MNLEQLLSRAQEIEGAIMQVATQLQTLQGHKAETAHWIREAQSPTSSVDETPVEIPTEPVIE